MTALKFWKKLDRMHDMFLLAVFLLLMLISNYCVYDSWYVYSHTQEEDIQKYKPTAEGYDPDSSPITDDMVAWLTIDGTDIDYPVMQGSDNGEYLNTDPYGGYSLSGSIFLDSGNAPDFSDDYSLVYGHHMKYGKMFGALDNFLDEGYLRSHTTGTLIIGKDAREIYSLKVFASARVRSDEKRVLTLAGSDGAREYIENYADVKISEPKGRIVALSTCADSDTVMRLIVFCYIE